MAEADAAVVAPSRTTSNLLRALGVTLAVIVFAVATLTYAYLRVAHQLDVQRARDECSQQTIASLSDAVSSLSGQVGDSATVLARINELASAFAQLSSPDPALREQARQRLAALAAQPPTTSSRSSSSTSATSTTSTTRSPSATTTTTRRPLVVLPSIPTLPTLQLAAAVDPCTTATTRGSP